MPLTPAALAALAPDAASWKAASGLTKDASWSGEGASDQLVWGLCKGSGAQPYRTVLDVSTAEAGALASSCSCPSRKFPCKHALALMVRASARRPSEGNPPDFAAAWAAKRAEKAAPKAPVVATPEDRVKAEKAAAKTRAATNDAVRGGLDALEAVLADLRRAGLAGAQARLDGLCRTLRVRLVDAKASALADRVGDWPRRVSGIPLAGAARAVLAESAALTLLARTFKANPDDPGARRAVVRGEDPREDPSALAVDGVWRCIQTVARDLTGNLSERTAFFARVDSGDGPSMARVVDVVHGASRPPTPAEQSEAYEGTMVFFAGGAPDRAVWRALPARVAALPWRPAPLDPLEAWRSVLMQEPWARDAVLALPAGALVEAGGVWWWRADVGGHALPMAGTPALAMRVLPLTQAFALWDGSVVHLLRASTLAGETTDAP